MCYGLFLLVLSWRRNVFIYNGVSTPNVENYWFEIHVFPLNILVQPKLFRFRFRQHLDQNLGFGFGYNFVEPTCRLVSVSAKFRFRSITNINMLHQLNCLKNLENNDGYPIKEIYLKKSASVLKFRWCITLT
jgi:hypothetical protein